jgi:hypothetical protein
MKRKYNVGSFLVVVVLLVARHLGRAQSVQSSPIAEAQETFEENNQRLNEVANAKLASAFPSSPTDEIGDSKMAMRLSSGLLALPTQLKEVSARRAIANHHSPDSTCYAPSSRLNWLGLGSRSNYQAWYKLKVALRLSPCRPAAHEGSGS